MSTLKGPGLQRYLGDPKVTNALVQEYIMAFRELFYSLYKEEIEKEGFLEEYRALRKKYARIFGGKDENYAPILGVHGPGLAGKLWADLGEYWKANRARYDEDPIEGLFGWLADMYVECLEKHAREDDPVFIVKYGGYIKDATELLLGVEKRRWPSQSET
jgi:hypothetical protein